MRSLQHKVTVHSVEEEAPGVVSVTMTGRDLHKLEASGGQFLHWRFLKRGMWWQAHPYSLSAVPTANRMRITVEDLGDHSNSLASIQPGTKVAIEGPDGAFTHEARHTDQVVLVAAGVGVTPVRALLEDLPRHVDVVAILRGASRRDLSCATSWPTWWASAAGSSTKSSGRARTRVSTNRASQSWCPTSPHGTCTCAVPADSCRASSPPPAGRGVRGERIHHEDFAF